MEKKQKQKRNIRWQLVRHDVLIYTVSVFFFLNFGTAVKDLVFTDMLGIYGLGLVCVFIPRFAMSAYSQILRYGGIQIFIRLLVSDGVGFFAFAFLDRFALSYVLPQAHIPFALVFAICSMNLLFALAIRMIYQYAYRCGNRSDSLGKVLRFLLRLFAGKEVSREKDGDVRKIKIAIVGAGRVGVSLAEDLQNNSEAPYVPCCFVDSSERKTGRELLGLPILAENETLFPQFNQLGVQEVVLAVPQIDISEKKSLYERYKQAGYKVKTYDFPTLESAGGKRRMRDFDIEDLLFRKTISVTNENTDGYYHDKVVLITGGGGSIGSELCRQIAGMGPKQLIILDICENGAYDIQQELKMHDKDLDVRVEIVSVCNRVGLERVFACYRPEVVLNAAAHKHVPLMEHNCIEAVENNVFGTLNTVELAEQYGAERVIMVSTDKAVNPTNVMGATKRMCEMIVLSHGKTSTTTTYSATRFGNVLGSAGSVIPLFRKQIANGGPITLTDKRIIRYFMTIPEAAQLVLQSGAMAKNGELFVLDMGRPVKILDLAENMIQLAGFEPYKDIDIVETGLRPGEKLYEELLVKTEELDRTDNSLIFIERDKPVGPEELDEKMAILRDAVASDSDDAVRDALHRVVPTYREPSAVNAAFDEKTVLAK